MPFKGCLIHNSLSIFVNSSLFSAKSIDEAHKIVRSLDPKSKFLFSKLEEPKNEDENENKKNENIVDEKQEALV